MDKLRVTVRDYGGGDRVNPGYQNPRRPGWYLATQEVIVPRAPLYAGICAQLLETYAGRCERLVLFEPGVGLGDFFRHILTCTRLPELFRLQLIGADVSREMTATCCRLLSALQPSPSWQPVEVQLHAGVNLLSLDAAELGEVTAPGPFQAVAASQFEHYYPNSPSSELASALRTAGLPASTKRDFRRFARNQLRSGGLYFSVDDYLSGDPERDRAQVRAWDKYVVTRFSDPEYSERIGAEFPDLAASLRRTYSRSFGEEKLLQKAAHARCRRRAICREEPSLLSAALDDLKAVFGSKNVSALPHPARETHGLFYLLSAQRE